MSSILVIDDQVVICELLKDVLTNAQYTVTTTVSPHEGIEKALTGSYDLIFLDLKMPHMSGTQVLEEIKKSDPDAVVVLMTGYPTFESAQLALKLGAYSFLTKPFTLDDITFIAQRGVSHRKLIESNKDLVKRLHNANMKLDDDIQERMRELTLLYEITQEISASLNLDETLHSITSKVTDVLKLERCSILLYDEKTDRLSIVASRGLSKEIITETAIPKGSHISGWVLEHKEAIFVSDIESDERFKSRSSEKYYTSSFISVPLIIKGNAIGVINVNNKKTHEPFTEHDFRLIKGIAREAAIAIANATLYSDLKKTCMETVIALTSAIDAKDHYTNWHSEQVMHFATAIAAEMHLPPAEIEKIRQACLLHDIGKIAVHDAVLMKQEKLTDEEWEEMKSHVTKSVEILRPLGFLQHIIYLVEEHHERYDGNGYPNQLKGEDILLGARIMSVADSFSAMVSERPYSQPLSRDRAIEELIKNKGTQFDPDVVDAFLAILSRNKDF
jgi:putative nucleotidyltransferase with HDIG domain